MRLAGVRCDRCGTTELDPVEPCDWPTSPPRPPVGWVSLHVVSDDPNARVTRDLCASCHTAIGDAIDTPTDAELDEPLSK